jgi:HSP20 family protein
VNHDPAKSDRLLRVSSSFMRGLPSVFGSLGGGDLTPQTDIKETDTEIVVTAELPGVKEADVSLTLQNDVLTIRGEKKSETRKEEDNYHMVERSYGSFQRSFRLPDSIDENACTADFNDGVLTVRVGKRKDARKAAKRIEIGRK